MQMHLAARCPSAGAWRNEYGLPMQWSMTRRWDERTNDTRYNLDEPQEHTEWRKPHTEYVLQKSVYVKFLEKAEGEAEVGSEDLPPMSMRELSEVMEMFRNQIGSCLHNRVNLLKVTEWYLTMGEFYGK